NVANLLLARTMARAREVAVRRALGAAGRRIGRQLLVESSLLTLLGAAAGLVLAHFGLRALVALAPADIPRLAEAGLDTGLLAFAVALGALVTLTFGLAPALLARGLDIQQALKSGEGRTSSPAGGGRRLRSAFVVGEVALAVTLAIGALLLLRSLWELRAVDPGFRTGGVLKAEYQLPDTRYPLDFSRWPVLPEILAFQAGLLGEVRALPGVEAAALASPHPLAPGWTNSFVIVGREAESADFPEVRTRFISPGYLETMGVPLLRGRSLRASDVAAETPVAVINHAAAERYFAGSDALGQRLTFWGVPWQIVGVIGDERFHGVAEETEPAVYAPMAQAPQQTGALLVRAAGDHAALVGPIRRRLHALDPQLAMFGVETIETTLARSIARQRFIAVLLGLFGVVALALALVGVHGLLSYVVAQRAAEVGIRRALGASRRDILRLVMGEGIALAGIGLVIGLAGAWAAARLVSSLLFGVTASDPLTFGAVSVVILLAATLASWLP
ncbi:MAG: FtsX-like permease family protein, partial [Solirubrobacterales bacterium]